MSKTKPKTIRYLVDSEIEFKIQAAIDGKNLTKWLEKHLNDYAKELKKRRNLTI